MTFILFWCAIYTPNAYTEQITVVLEFSIQATLLLFSIWYVLKHFDLILKKINKCNFLSLTIRVLIPFTYHVNIYQFT